MGALGPCRMDLPKDLRFSVTWAGMYILEFMLSLRGCRQLTQPEGSDRKK